MTLVSQSNSQSYKLKVQNGGEIKLDTGDREGTVVITGNLEVKGSSFTIDSSDLQISDNILRLSEGTEGNGLPSSVDYISGIEIDRGDLVNSRWVFDEQISWSLGGTSGDGTFYAIAGNQKLPLNTPGIVAEGNLYIDTANGAISVTNTPNYEQKIFNYDNNEIKRSQNESVIKDDDLIPNTRALVDYVDFVLSVPRFDSIGEGNTEVETFDQTHDISDIESVETDGDTTILTTGNRHRFTSQFFVNISGIDANGDPLENLNGTNIEILEVIDARTFRVDVDISNANTSLYNGNGIVERSGTDDPKVIVRVNGNNIANYYENKFEVGNVRISDNNISNTVDNQDLVLSALDTGTVKIDDVLELPKAPHDSSSFDEPISPSDGSKIYTKEEKTGGTGIFFVNENNTRDEITSRRKSLFYSLIL